MDEEALVMGVIVQEFEDYKRWLAAIENAANKECIDAQQNIPGYANMSTEERGRYAQFLQQSVFSLPVADPVIFKMIHEHQQHWYKGIMPPVVETRIGLPKLIRLCKSSTTKEIQQILRDNTYIMNGDLASVLTDRLPNGFHNHTCEIFDQLRNRKTDTPAPFTPRCVWEFTTVIGAVQDNPSETTTNRTSTPIYQRVNSRICAACYAQGINYKKCSQCKVEYYCSRECQRKDWKSRHKYECAELVLE